MVADTFVCPDSVLIIRPVIPAGAAFFWSDAYAGLERLIERPGHFTLTVDDGRCRSEALLTVHGGDCLTPIVFAPNVFSPNQDGLHDRFEVTFRNAESIEELSIYDRWGNLLWQTSGDIYWDGQARGRPAAPGVYLYVLKVKRKDGQYVRLSGSTTVVR